MRIVAGRHRGRRLAAPPGRDLRPTSDRAREAVFNILTHGRDAVAGARVLDAFAGTGAMGLEALSRGAAHATFMDSDCEPCRANVEALGETGGAAVIEGDCLHPPPADAPCRLVFLDPPYGGDLAAPALVALGEAGWIADGAVCVVEVAAGETFAVPDGFEPFDERHYGAARIVFLEASAAAE